MLKYLIIITVAVTSAIYYYIGFGSVEISISQMFLIISTFLFVVFTGFFISRQGIRYSKIRDQITDFDGEATTIYRQFGHLGMEAQKEVKEILKNHYESIISHQAWDFHFINPSDTITSFHRLAEKYSQDKQLASLQHLALQRILTALENMQVTRKSMVAMHKERIPQFQWFLVYFLAAILVSTVSIIPSTSFFLGSLLKGSFASAVIIVVVLLHQFDGLNFFEGTIGENSAKDVLDIISGEK